MPGHRNDWRHTVILFGATGLFESLAFGHLSAFTPLYLRELGVPGHALDHWTGLLSALGFVIGLPLLPLWGVWADRYGRKIIIIRSSIFAALIYALHAVAENVYWLAVARFLGGFVLGNTGVMMAVQADITPRDRLGTAVAFISAAPSIGMAVGPILGGYIIRGFGLRSLLWLDSVVTALVVLALVFWLKEEPRPDVEPTSTRAGVKQALQAIIHSPAVLRLFGVTFLFALGIGMSAPYAPLLIESIYRGPHAEVAPVIGWLLTLTGVAMAVTTPFWGGLGDRVGHLPILRICALAVAGALAGQALATAIMPLGVLRAAQGLFMGGISALVMVLLARYAPSDRRSSILTLSLLPHQLSWFLGPLLGAALASTSLRGVFWVSAGLLAIGVLVSMRLPRAADT